MINRRLTIFKIIAFILPFFIFILLEILLHLFLPTTNDPYMDIGPLSFFEEIDMQGQKYYKLAHYHAYKEKIQTFAQDKPPNTIRIFCLGGSASASWPHPVKETCSYYLQQALENAFSQKVEVLDVSGHGFASYRVRAVFDKIIHFNPDALLIYCGNNEFLENRTYNTSGVYTFLDKLSSASKIATLLKKAFYKAKLSSDKLQNEAPTFWKKIKKESLALRKDAGQYAYLKKHYHQSMAYMLNQAEQLKIPVILYTIPVNLKDWLPNVSYQLLEGEQLKQWTTLYTLGLKHLLQNDADDAIRSLQQALELAPEHAESYFWLARAYEENGNYQAALQQYQNAKDFDYNPFRAPSDINRIIRMLAADHHQYTYLLDLETIFKQNAAHGIPGFDLFLDYVHPTKKGNLLIAENVFKLILSKNLLPYHTKNQEFIRQDISYPPDNQPYDEKTTYVIQLTLFDVYTMNHQYDMIIKQAAHLNDLVAKYGGKMQFGARIPYTVSQKVSDAYQTFSRYQLLKKYEIMGKTIDPDTRAKIFRLYDQFYNSYYSFDQFLQQ